MILNIIEVILDVLRGCTPTKGNAGGKEDKRLELHIQITKIDDLGQPQCPSLYSHQTTESQMERDSNVVLVISSAIKTEMSRIKKLFGAET